MSAPQQPDGEAPRDDANDEQDDRPADGPQAGDGSDSDIAELVQRMNAGDEEARAEMVQKVNDSMHDIAQRFMRSERKNHTLQPSGLVNEAWAELLGHGQYPLSTRKAFLATAAKIMRHILVNHARRRSTIKRGGDRQRVSDTSVVLENYAARPLSLHEFLDVSEAVQRLEKADPEAAKVIDLRFFAELTLEQCAEVLGVSKTTVQNRYNAGRDWLREALGDREA